jgi:glycosyltransferase involved in cell wall biosynthesis
LRIGIDARLAYRRGVGTYTANLVLSLAKIDRKNKYVIFNAPEILRRQVKSPRFQWKKLPFFNAAYYEQFLLPRTAKRMDLDFLHYTDNSGPVSGDFPFVLTLHDVMHERTLSCAYPSATLRQRLVHAYKRWAVPRAARRARAILTVSEFSRHQIVQRLGIKEKRIIVTPEGVDMKLFKKTKRKKTKLFKILVHGATDDRKNLSNILKAGRLLADQGRNFQFVVIGMEEAELKSTGYLGQAMDLDLGRYLEWAGNVPMETLKRICSELDLLLYVSRLEGFGLPVLEAFACGLPVVASNTSSLPEVAGPAALLVNPESPEAIAKAVGKIMDRPVLRQLLIRRGLKRARLFSWEKTAELTLKVYERMKPCVSFQ